MIAPISNDPAAIDSSSIDQSSIDQSSTDPSSTDLRLSLESQTGTPRPKRWTVVLSRGQSRHPEKRGLETAVASLASKLDGVTVIDIPHLYDLPKDGPSFQQLREVEDDILVASWIYGRAARWVLDRNGVRGRQDETEHGDAESEKSEIDDQIGGDDASQTGDAKGVDTSDEAIDRVTDLYPRPDRQIQCVELGNVASADEVIATLQKFIGRQNDSAKQASQTSPATGTNSLPIVGGQLLRVDETTSRRWYPVIDFDRCTNCMECVDFCLFGVYGLDGAETILVEQPDNCRKGCPACSRVCPENAIIFPQHKAPAIAGAEVEGGEGFKIDLSQLFGAPAGGDDPIATAARERDEQLLLTGRDAVGIDETLARRQSERAALPKDDLDALIDQLDALDV